MKILEIGLFPTLGGIESFTYNLINNIDREKYCFDFWVIGNNGKTYYEKQINDLYGNDYNHFYYLPNIKRNFIEANKMIISLLNSNHYDLIYLNSDTSAKILYCLYAIIKQKKKIIIHCHSSSGKKFNHTLFRPIMNKLCSYRIACSDKAARWMYGKAYVDKVSIIPNGVDTKRFAFKLESRILIRKELNVKNEDVLIGNIGRFIQVKNQEFIVDLLKYLPGNYKAILIGDGNLKNEICKKVDSMRLSDRIIILSARNNVEEYYSAMDIFLLPSIFEGFPIVAVEAQCSGLPCILSNNITRMCGVSPRSYFLELDHIEWTKKILSINKDRLDGVKIIKNTQFDIKYQAKMIIDIFEKCVG